MGLNWSVTVSFLLVKATPEMPSQRISELEATRPSPERKLYMNGISSRRKREWIATLNYFSDFSIFSLGIGLNRTPSFAVRELKRRSSPSSTWQKSFLQATWSSLLLQDSLCTALTSRNNRISKVQLMPLRHQRLSL